MSAIQQYQEPVRCILFGETLLLPVDTAVRVSVEAFEPHPVCRPGGKDVLAYTVGMRFAVSHASLAARTRTFTERADRLKIDVRTSRPYDGTWFDELAYIRPILHGMEDMAIRSYYEGEVSFAALRDYFATEYRRRQGTRSRRKSPRH